MPATIMRFTDDTLDRLEALATEYGTDVDTVVRRLLDRDAHDHDHACPTCASMARRGQSAALMPDETPLFAVMPA